MLSKKTLANVMNKYFDSYRNYSNRVKTEYMDVCISNGNTKIGKTMNVSIGYTGCIESGAFIVCGGSCYSVRDMVRHPNSVIPARAKNQALAEYDRDNFFEQIKTKMSRRRKNFYFRWHVAGEIIDYDYFCCMVEIAKEFPNFKIWTYTKRYDIVNKYCAENGGRAAIPENFNIMFSAWPGLNMANPYNFPRFEFIPKTENNLPHKFTCPGNCDYCKKHNTGCIAGVSTNCREH